MGDVFKEQIVKKMPSSKDNLIKVGLIAAAIVIVYLAMVFIAGFMPIVLIAVGFGVFYVFNNLKKEYEYIFTNGELDIDCIYGKTRRKRKFTCDVKESLVMSHHSRKDAEHELKTATATLDFSSGSVSDDTFYLLALQNGKRVKVIFEPNEMMFNAIKTYISPRKLLKKQ